MSIDLDAYREQSRASWGEMARGWEERRGWFLANTRVVIDRLLEQAAPHPGQTFLELACGPGDVGFAVAERVGDEGRVIATDFSPEMIDVARRAAEARGLANVEFRVIDAEHIDLGDASVDGVVCRWGYMLMADPAAAFAETRRVLRGGGPLAFTVWAGPERNPWAAAPAMTLVRRGHVPPPEPGLPGIFALADPDRVRGLVTAAGFGEPELEEISFDFRYADADDLWGTLLRLAGPLARAIDELDADERHATRIAIEQSLEPYRQDDGSYRAPAVTWCVLAR
jgi:ubiquinone/menaquinone biosynthesis C-methylase UbiE